MRLLPIPIVRKHLDVLKLPFMLQNHQTLAQAAVDKHWSHLEYLTELISGEAQAREDRRVARCIQQARFPVLKTLDQFDWNWPTKINRLLIQNLFHLDFVKQHANVVFVSGGCRDRWRIARSGSRHVDRREAPHPSGDCFRSALRELQMCKTCVSLFGGLVLAQTIGFTRFLAYFFRPNAILSRGTAKRPRAVVCASVHTLGVANPACCSRSAKPSTVHL